MTTQKRIIISLMTVFSWAVLSSMKASSSGFEGYFAPCLLISPMRDDQIYTPVGMGVVTSKAGFRVHPVTGKGDFHNGVDLAAKLNDKVFNLLDGMVTRVGYRGNMGCAVEVYNPYPNIRVICGHLNAYAVKPGQWVQRGQVIGFAGSTGRSTGVHVHYTVIKNDSNQYIEPMKYLMQVPEYVMALKSARIQTAARANAAAFKKKQASAAVEKDNDDELPKEGSEEATPPVAQKK
jgi:hypothetical protein